MKKKIILAAMLFSVVLLGGCGDKGDTQESGHDVNVSATLEESVEMSSESVSETFEAESEKAVAELPDGVYTAEFTTDSSMFRVNEVYEGKGTLTVENGEMTIHISLGSKKIVNLYSGLAEDAQKEGAKLLMPTEDSVTYSDGITEEVYGYDVPVPYLDAEFDLALIGTKGNWYDHKVNVSNPVPAGEGTQADNTDSQAGNIGTLEDGTYSIEITFEGGSGKAEILSPVMLTVTDGNVLATVEWSSPNYDYMIVGEEKYLPVNTEGNSVFEIPVLVFDGAMDIIGDTVAMSKPYEVEYTLTFHSDTMKKE